MGTVNRRTALVAVTALAGAFLTTGCGADTGAAGPDAASPSAATSTLAIQPQSSGDPFKDARAAAAHMPMTAKVLAGGFATAAKLSGDVAAPASDLRATLTAGLQEHVYLAGMAVATAYTKGAGSAEFTLAAGAVDANAVDLAKAVGSVAGADNEAQFLQGFRAHVQDFVAYAVAAKAGDRAGRQRETADLAAYARSQGAFFARVTGGALPAAAVTEAFNHHIGALAKAVDALAAGKTEAYNLLRHAAGHMPAMAATMAAGIAKATKMAGDPASPAAKLRADLTAALQEHVYLAGIAVFTAYTAGTGSAAYQAAASTLDANSMDLAATVGTLAGADNGAMFLTAWREHITLFVDYAVATAARDQAKRAAAMAKLDAYRGAAGRLFEKLSGGALPAGAVAEDLTTHIATLAGTVDSLAAALVKT